MSVRVSVSTRRAPPCLGAPLPPTPQPRRGPRLVRARARVGARARARARARASVRARARARARATARVRAARPSRNSPAEEPAMWSERGSIPREVRAAPAEVGLKG